MSDKGMDRRVSRTRRLIREAFLSLVLEQGYESLTIEQLAERAQIARGTFYLHYRDKEDLLLAIVGELIDDLIDQLSDIPISAWQLPEEGVARPHELIFQHAADHADLYRIVLRGEVTFSISKRLRAIITDAASRFLTYKLDQDGVSINPDIPLMAYVSGLAGSLLSTIGWWLEAEMPYGPTEMALIYQEMFFRGFTGVLEVDSE